MMEKLLRSHLLFDQVCDETYSVKEDIFEAQAYFKKRKPILVDLVKDLVLQGSKIVGKVTTEEE